MVRQRALAVLHAIATTVRSRVFRRGDRERSPIDYKGWRITLTSMLEPGKGWAPGVRIAAIDDASVPETQLAPRRFFATKAEADGYAANMGIATVETALGGWRVRRPRSSESERDDLSAMDR